MQFTQIHTYSSAEITFYGKSQLNHNDFNFKTFSFSLHTKDILRKKTQNNKWYAEIHLPHRVGDLLKIAIGVKGLKYGRNSVIFHKLAWQCLLRSGSHLPIGL